jgi:hypothetical protein
MIESDFFVRQSQNRYPVFIAASKASVNKLPHAAPTQPNLGISATFNPKFARAAATCELVR